MGAAGLRRLERQDRGADIAAELCGRAGGFEQVGDQRGGSGFSVGPGNGDERGVGRMQPPFAAKQLDVADHLNAGRLGKACGPVRGRVGQRDARTEDQRGDLSPVDLAQVSGRNAGMVGCFDALGAIVERHHVGAAGQERAGACGTRAGESEQRDFPTCE